MDLKKAMSFLSRKWEHHAPHPTVPLVGALHSGLLGMLSVEKLLSLTLPAISPCVTVER